MSFRRRDAQRRSHIVPHTCFRGRLLIEWCASEGNFAASRTGWVACGALCGIWLCVTFANWTGCSVKFVIHEFIH